MYYLDLSDLGVWLIKHTIDKNYRKEIGFDKNEALEEIERLNKGTE